MTITLVASTLNVFKIKKQIEKFLSINSYVLFVYLFFFRAKHLKDRNSWYLPLVGGVCFTERQKNQNAKAATPSNAKKAETMKGVAILLTEDLLSVEK